MAKLDLNTKVKILKAAEKVFHANGFNGTRTTTIAKVAGISRTMLHYYFNSKEDLFKQVLESSLGINVNDAQTELMESKNITELVNSLVSFLCALQYKKPGLASFLVNIFNESPELLKVMVENLKDDFPNLIQKILTAEQNDGKVIKNINGENLMLNIIGLCATPFLFANYIKEKEKRNDDEMQAFVEEREQMIKDFILNAIKVR